MSNLVNNFLNVILNNYVNYNGRANRYEYWMFVLANFIIGAVFSLLSTLVAGFFNYVYYLITLALLLPSVCLTIRRLHDINRSGLWILLAFVPIGNIILIVWLATAGTPGDNEYGPAV